MLTQKLYRNGNSVAVTIPKDYLKNLDLKEGEEVVLIQEEDTILISKNKKINKSSITPEFLSWMESFNKEYGAALKELAKK